MKLTALSIALVAAVGLTTGCSTQSAYQQTAAIPASDAQAQYALGRFYQGQERYALAIEAYRRALAANPDHVSAHNGLGASLLLTGKTAEAIEQFKTGLKHQPRSAALWNNLGYAYALSGEPKLAEMAYKQSLDLDPTDYKTNTNLAMVQKSTSESTPATAVAIQPQEETKSIQTVETRSMPVYPAQTPATEIVPPKAGPAALAAIQTAEKPLPPTAAAIETQSMAISPAQPAKDTSTKAAASEPVILAQTSANVSMAQPAPVKAIAPINVAPAELALDRKLVASPDISIPVETTHKPQPVIEVAKIPVMQPSVQVAKVAPQVFEVNLTSQNTNTDATPQLTPIPAQVAGTKRISVPLREDVTQIASVEKSDFVLEIRNGNGVRHMAFQTSQQLAGQGYTTNYLTNEPGFNVKVTQVLYLPGYLEEAKRLLAHLPKETVLTENENLRQGTQVRVVLGHDMTQQQTENKTTQVASRGDDFVLEIRNGNGVRHLAFQTSQYLAGQGYKTNYLTNQAGFNVKVTRVFYLPGYLEEAKRLLAHLPKDTMLTQTPNLRSGTHVRVVLGKDMVDGSSNQS